MGIFDRFTNPVWHNFNSLSSQEKLELSFLITLQDYLRSVLNGEKELVSALEYIASTSKNPAFFKNGKRITPFSTSVRERLIDELEIGFLTCSSVKTLESFKFKFFKAPEYFSGLGGLVLAEINSRIGRKSPSTLEEAGYSQDPDECKVQILIKWMEILGLDNSEFINHSSSAFFTPLWDSYHKNFFSGAITGFHRSDKEQLFKRAKIVYSSLSPLGKEIFSYLVNKLKGQKSVYGDPPQNHPPKLQNENADSTKEKEMKSAEILFNEIKERTFDVGGKIQSKINTKMNLLKPIKMKDGDIDLQKINQMGSYLNAQNTFLFFMGLVGMRESKANRSYFNSVEFKYLENRITQSAIKWFMHGMKEGGFGELCDKETISKSMMETTIKIRKTLEDYCVFRQRKIPNPEKNLVSWYSEQISLDDEDYYGIKNLVQKAILDTLKEG